MDKFAKYSPKWKASTDPAQDKLRSAKANWNAKASEFIEDLLNFKWLFNGRPGVFHQSKSSLFEKLPGDPATIINVLSADFKEIVQGANAVIKLQEDYAKTRKRKTSKTANINHGLISQAASHQELIGLKKSWNKKSKEFLNDFINFIWLMNGKSNKFLMERSSIGEAMPADPTTIIGSLSIDFDSLVAEANSIIDYQDNLHQTMQSKKQSSLADNLLIKYSDDHYDLLSEGSNPLTRFWAKLTNPAFGSGKAARIKRFRIALLNRAAPLYKDFALFQKHIVGVSDESIKESVVVFNKIEKDISFIANNIKTMLLSMERDAELESEKEESVDLEDPFTVSFTGGTPAPDTTAPPTTQSLPSQQPSQQPPQQPAAPITTPEPLKPVAEPPNNDNLAKVESVIAEFNSKASVLMQNKALRPLIQEMRKALIPWNVASKVLENPNIAPDAKSKALENKNNAITQIMDAWNNLNAAIASSKLDNSSAVDNLEKVAQHYLSRWMGRTLHQSPFAGDTSPLRLECYNDAELIRKNLDGLMNSLEKEFDLDKIKSLFKEILEKFYDIKNNIRALADIVTETSDDKTVSEFLSRNKYKTFSRNIAKMNKAESIITEYTNKLPILQKNTKLTSHVNAMGRAMVMWSAAHRRLDESLTPEEMTQASIEKENAAELVINTWERLRLAANNKVD